MYLNSIDNDQNCKYHTPVDLSELFVNRMDNYLSETPASLKTKGVLSKAVKLIFILGLISIKVILKRLVVCVKLYKGFYSMMYYYIYISI